jgi:hypothetical protein
MSPVYQTERVGQMDQCLSKEVFKEVIRPDRTEDVDFKKWYELRRKLSRKKRPKT